MNTEEWHEQVMSLPHELRLELAECLAPDWSLAEVAEDGAVQLPLDTAARELFAQVLLLPVAERRALVAALDESLLPEDEWERECVLETQRRMERMRQGKEGRQPLSALLKVLGR